MEYQVKPGFRGKRTVAFNCSTCRSDLEAPLEEAGQKFPCPTCGHEIATPGVRELREMREVQQAEERRRADEAVAREQQAKQEAERRTAAEAEKRREKEAQRARRKADAPPPRPTSLRVFMSVLLISLALVYALIIYPLQRRLARAESALTALAQTVDANAKAAKSSLESLAKVVDANAEDTGALAKAVDHNATAAKATAASVTVLARNLAEVDRIASNANRHAHSHGFGR